MNNLDKMFSDFEDRKRREQEASDQERLNEQQLRKAAIKILVEAVLPIVRELSTEIQQRGHKARVIERFENHNYPSVELAFTPRISGSDPYTLISESTLRFAHTKTGQIEVRQEIKGQQGKYSKSEYRGTPPSEVNQEWVRSKVLAFIDAVLKAN